MKNRIAQSAPFNVIILVILVFVVATVIIGFFVHFMGESSEQLDIRVDSISENIGDRESPTRLDELKRNFPSMNRPEEPGRFYYQEDGDRLFYVGESGAQQRIQTEGLKGAPLYRVRDDGKTIREVYAPEEIALFLNLGHRFTSKSEAQTRLRETIEAMNSYTIAETTKTDQMDTSHHRLQIFGEEQRDLTAYVMVPKSSVSSAEQLNDQGTGEPLLIEKDPVIGMHFNGTVMNRSFSYETRSNKDGEDTLVYVSYEPVSSEGPHVSVSYRTRPCAPYEATLFTIRSLEASRIQAPQTDNTYHVCLGHKSLDLTLSREDGSDNGAALMNITERGLINVSEREQTISVEATNGDISSSDLVFANARPGKNYTCIGSLETEEGGLYGDCRYTPHKIWLSIVDEEAAESGPVNDRNVTEPDTSQKEENKGLEDFQLTLIIAIIFLCGIILAATWYTNRKGTRKK